MRRSLVAFSASFAVLAFAPAAALARHRHHPRHHSHHHARVHHARIRRFGDVSSPASGPSGATSGSIGTVQSFTNGVLTILLNDNSTVQGTVTGDTEFECISAASSSPGDDQGEDSGPQSSGGGDDQAAQTSTDSADAGDQPTQDSEDDGGDGADSGQSSCSSANLTPGTVVQAAELRLSSAGAEWEKLVLQS
jgi:hypothetical protein